MKRSRVIYWVIGICIAAGVIAAAFYFDQPMRDFLAQHQNRTLKIFMLNVSRFGDWPEHVALGLVLLAAAWWRGSKKWLRIFLSMLIALALAGAAARVLKIGAGRARPSVQAGQVWSGPRLSSKFYAFPSGHVAASVGFFAVLLFVRWQIGIGCMAIPLLIGFARMYVGAHYLSDVICATVLGILCAAIVTHFALRKIDGRN